MAPRVPHCLDQLRVDVKPHPMRKNAPRAAAADPHRDSRPRAMIALFNKLLDWFKALFWKEEMELTLVGLQYSGKTTFVNVIAVIKPSSLHHRPRDAPLITDRSECVRLSVFRYNLENIMCHIQHEMCHLQKNQIRYSVSDSASD